MSGITGKTTRSQFEATNTVLEQISQPAPKKARADLIYELPSIEVLPPELMIQIFSECTAAGALVAARVCKDWHDLANDNTLWNLALRRDFNQPAATDAKETYKKCHHTERNRTNGVYTSDLLKGHTSPVNCVIGANGKLISASDDHTIKIWDSETLACETTLIGHNDEKVKCLAADNGNLCSASRDGVIKIWDLNTGLCKVTFENAGRVQSLAIEGNSVYSGSADGKIRIWNLQTGECKTIDDAHERKVKCLSIANNKLYSGSSDGTVKVWDLKTSKCEATIPEENEEEEEEDKDIALAIVITNDTLIIGFGSGKIEIRNLTTYEIEKTLKIEKTPGEPTTSVRSLTVDKNMLFSGSSNNMIQIWDLKTGDCKTTLQEDSDESFISTAIVNGKLFSCCQTSTLHWNNWITVWDFTASDRKVFMELAEELHRAEPLERYGKMAMERLLRMPAKEREKINNELTAIIKLRHPQYSGRLEDLLPALDELKQIEEEQNSCLPTFKEIAQAIRNYLGVEEMEVDSSAL